MPECLIANGMLVDCEDLRRVGGAKKRFWVFNLDGIFRKKCNMGMVQLEELVAEDKTAIHDLLKNHFKYTKSTVAKEILDHFDSQVRRFIKVMPIEYKKIIEMKSEDEKLDLAEVSDA